ncbi:protein LURP-one-related 5-like [Magnolia sinica]|uniref:protein LURP-one-related 5-like n=1 Tax=Magnolia sinica TaxID=86752 RepID=UPI0026595042|nr:protein LURP-one-related 5-like [Magnolia sinica]
MGGGIVEESFCYEEETHLTVLKTSHFFEGDGFTVYDSNGQIVFRVDSYGPEAGNGDELVLMNATGKCLLTVHRKRASLHHRWEGFLGERMNGQKHIFSVHRSSMIGRTSVTAEVYGSPVVEYQIEGSYSHRCCTFYSISASNGSRVAVAEIKRKVTASAHVMLGKDVFWLYLKPGFDGAFAMALVIVLDQINGDDDYDGSEIVDDDGDVIESTVDDSSSPSTHS